MNSKSGNIAALFPKGLVPKKLPLVWLIERRHFLREPGKEPAEEWKACGRIRANSRDEAEMKAWAAVGDPNPNNVRVTGIAVHGQEIEPEAK